jgi:hypothetical protein
MLLYSYLQFCLQPSSIAAPVLEQILSSTTASSTTCPHSLQVLLRDLMYLLRRVVSKPVLSVGLVLDLFPLWGILPVYSTQLEVAIPRLLFLFV